MSADLDALLTCLYVLVDDLLPARRRFGRPPRISDSELICLAIAQVLLDCPNERRFLRLAKRRLGHLFPYIPGQSGLQQAAARAGAAAAARRSRCSRRLSPSFCDRLRLLDSTPVPCAASRETVRRSALAGIGGYGYCRSHSRWFWGFRLYLLCAPDGLPVGFELAPANAPERVVAAELLERVLAARPDRDRRQRLRRRRVRTARPLARRHASCAPTAKTNNPASARSAASANGSSRPSTPSKTNSHSNATAAAPSPASSAASPDGYSPSPPSSSTTGNSAHPGRNLTAYDH